MSDLFDFLAERYDEDRAYLHDDSVSLVEAGDLSPASWEHLIRFRDNVACNQTILRTARQITDPVASSVLRAMLLILCQPYAEHPDFDQAWLDEIKALLTPMGA